MPVPHEHGPETDLSKLLPHAERQRRQLNKAVQDSLMPTIFYNLAETAVSFFVARRDGQLVRMRPRATPQVVGHLAVIGIVPEGEPATQYLHVVLSTGGRCGFESIDEAGLPAVQLHALDLLELAKVVGIGQSWEKGYNGHLLQAGSTPADPRLAQPFRVA